MPQRIATIALLVRDYDEAIAYYTEALGFRLVEDTVIDVDKRWVIVIPPGGPGTALLLAKAADPRQMDRVGDQTGGRVFLFLETDDFRRDHRRMQSRGVVFREQPRIESYGMVAVFEDLYGNLWDLIEPRPR
jgi:catechol 2,3-dioxygenase-like lactoylglutathione lyase family enzyme